MVMGGGLAAGEVGGNFLINGAGRRGDFAEELTQNFPSTGSTDWVYGAFKSQAKWAGQLAKRGWIPQ